MIEQTDFNFLSQLYSNVRVFVDMNHTARCSLAEGRKYWE